jgi:hypothetical protein
VAVGNIDHKHIATRLDKCLCSLQVVFIGSNSCANVESACVVFICQIHGFVLFQIFDGDKSKYFFLAGDDRNFLYLVQDQQLFAVLEDGVQIHI